MHCPRLGFVGSLKLMLLNYFSRPAYLRGFAGVAARVQAFRCLDFPRRRIDAVAAHLKFEGENNQDFYVNLTSSSGRPLNLQPMGAQQFFLSVFVGHLCRMSLPARLRSLWSKSSDLLVRHLRIYISLTLSKEGQAASFLQESHFVLARALTFSFVMSFSSINGTVLPKTMVCFQCN